MSIAARTATAEQRSAIYAALGQRNRFIGVLRIGIPAIGAIILGGLLMQLYWGSIAPDFGFANISLDRDNVVVDAPSYAGVGDDGTTYQIEAATARSSVADTDVVHLDRARFSMTQLAGSTFEAAAQSARLVISTQTVAVEGITEIGGDSGVAGTIEGAVLDIDDEAMHSTGAANLTLSGGATLKAETMAYDAASRRWRFTRATLDFEATPGEEAYLARNANTDAPEETAQ